MKKCICFALLMSIVLYASAEDVVSVRDLVRASREAMQAGQLDQAHDQAKAAIALDPASADSWAQYGAVSFRREEYTEAAKAFRDALELAPERKALWRELARSQSKAGDPASAIRSMQHYLDIPDVRDPAALRDQARWLAHMEDLEQAIRVMKQALDQDPEQAIAWRDLGMWQWREQGIVEARSSFEQSFELGGKDPQAFKLKMIANVADSRQAEAAADLSEDWLPDLSGLQVVNNLKDSGRRHAAGVMIEALHAKTPSDPEVCLELADVRAKSGSFKELDRLLMPVLRAEKNLPNAERQARCTSLLRRAWSVPGMIEIAIGMADLVPHDSADGGVLTEVLENQAAMLYARGDVDESLALYDRVFTRDMNRSAWPDYYRLLKKQGADAVGFLDKLAANAPEGPVRSGVLGLKAELAKDNATARKLYDDSLAGIDSQPELRQRLYNLQMAAGLEEEAAKNLKWFFTKVREGRNDLRSHLAEMLTLHREDQQALLQWRILNAVSPGSSYYAIEAARILMENCQPDQALKLIEDTMEHGADARLYEMKAGIEQQLGRPLDAMRIAVEGLEKFPSVSLHRVYAENAEAAGLIDPAKPGVCSNVLKSTAAVILENPGYESMVQMHGRALEALDRTNEVRRYYEGMLDRNPGHLPALTALRHSAVRSGELEYGKDVSLRMESIRPDDWRIRRMAAMSEGELQHYHEGLERLRSMSRISVDAVIPVLAYRNISACNYPGRVNVHDLMEHLIWLKQNGYSFMTPGDLPELESEPISPVMILILRPSPEVFAEIDAGLAKHPEIRLTCAASPAMTRQGSVVSLVDRLQKGMTDGRWYLMSGGPDDVSRKACVPGGRLANDFIHRRQDDGESESLEQFTERSLQTLSGLSDSLGNTLTRSMWFPSGNYGQFGLDVEPLVLDAVNHAVRPYFDFAFSADSAGFIVPESLPHRLPARIVPAGWSVEELAHHLIGNNPVIRARFDQAKLLYWSRQYELARPIFEELFYTHFEEVDVRYNLGATAFREGDLSTAMTALENALVLDSDERRSTNLLVKVKDRYRPVAMVEAATWEDNEDRDYERIGLRVDDYLNRDWRWGGAIARETWQRDGQESIRGTRYSIPLRVYLDSGAWLDGRGWAMDYDDIDDTLGGSLLLRRPSEWLNGYYKLRVLHQDVDTIDAIRAGIDQNRFHLETYSRLYDEWDLFLRGSYVDRSDDNVTTEFRWTMDYRLKENPFLAPGYRGAFADSDFDPEEYWAPLEFQEHLAYLTLRGTQNDWYYATSVEGGYGKEQDEDWGFIWGARGMTSLQLSDSADIYLEGSIYEGSVYERFYLSAGLSLQW